MRAAGIYLRALLVMMLTLALAACIDDGICGNSCGCDGGNGPIPPEEHVIYDMYVRGETYAQLSDTSSTPTETSYVPSGTIVDALHYLLDITAVTQRVASDTSSTSFFSFLFGKPASACSIAPPETYISDVVSQITITSAFDFSAAYPAGSSLNALFTVTYSDGSSNVNVDVDEFVASSPTGAEKVQIILTQVPDISKTHDFKIEYSLVDGEYFELFTGLIEFE